MGLGQTLQQYAEVYVTVTYYYRGALRITDRKDDGVKSDIEKK